MSNNSSHLSCLVTLKLMKIPILTSNDVCYAVGDVHGDLNQFLHPLRELMSNLSVNGENYLIYLGDYIDRGEFDAYIYCLIRTIQNAKLPSNVHIIFIRGNHEQLMTNTDFFIRFRTQDEGEKRPTNKHPLFNVSFVWCLFNALNLPLYYMLRTSEKQVLLFTHAPVLTADKLFAVDVENGVLKTKPISIDGNDDAIKGHRHFTTIDANFDPNTKKHSKFEDFKAIVNASMLNGKTNSTGIEVKNIFGHIHSTHTESVNMISEFLRGSDKNDVINGFVCLDIDASYGFRFVKSVINNDRICTKGERKSFYSRVFFLKIVNGKGETRSCGYIDKDANDGAFVNFNSIKNLKELKSKMNSCSGLKDIDWSGMDKHFDEVVNEFKLRMSKVKPEPDNYNFDDIVYKIYVDMFKKHILATSTITKMMMFDNVPFDVIKAAGYKTEFKNEQPYEIYISAIDKRIRKSNDDELIKSWAFNMSNDKPEPFVKSNVKYNAITNANDEGKLKGGIGENDMRMFRWFMLAVLLVISIVIVVVVIMGINVISQYWRMRHPQPQKSLTCPYAKASMSATHGFSPLRFGV